MGDRILQPKVIETKQQLLQALKNGELQASKYNLLNQNEKLFVELVAFGDYTGEQAIRVIDPMIRAPQAAANRLLANPNVAATLEELTVQRDKKFMAEVSTARDMALNKLKYIMTTTKDDALAAACAKTILDKANDAMKNTKKEEEPVGQVRFAIQVENVYTGPVNNNYNKEEPVIITLEDQQTEKLQQEKEQLEGEIEDLKKKKKPLMPETVNPNTGLPYVISYEGVNAYDGGEDEDQMS
jgi:polyhydroxyalkanoate synthesis regulator phasin